MKNRNYCFTYMVDKLENGKMLKKGFDTKVKYLIFQKEKCPTTGKEHLQGYIELLKPMRFNAVKGMFFSNSVHLEKRMGTRDQAIEYCSKEESRIEGPFEWGEKGKTQGHRTDLDIATEALKNGKSIEEVALECPGTFVKFHRGLRELRNVITNNKKDRDINVTVLWGKTGTGKTRKAMDGDRDNIYKIDLINDTIWFDGYDGQTTLVIDEFYGQCKPSLLLKLLDRYPIRLPVKGASVMANWNKVFITSNKPPKEWYSNISDEVYKALERRITEVIEMK